MSIDLDHKLSVLAAAEEVPDAVASAATVIV